MKTLVLIDSNAVIHRAYHALPKTMSTSTGVLTNAVYGYATTLIKVLEDLKPEYIAASFDVSKATFRLAEYSEYKAHRIKADQELYDQIPLVREMLAALNIPVYEMEGFEADDVIGTIAHKVQVTSNNNQTIDDQQLNILHTYIVTGDKDAFQLVDGNIEVYDLRHGLREAQIINSTVIRAKYNLDPYDFIDLKALAGDPSDNIPGVPGIGPKTATTLIQRFDTLVKLYEEIEKLLPAVISTDLSFVALAKEGAEKSSSPEKISPPTPWSRDDKLIEAVAKRIDIKPRILRLLIEHKEQAFLSQRLATIRKDVPIDFDIEKCRWGDYDKEELRVFFEKMQFHSLLRRFGATHSEEESVSRSEEPVGAEVKKKNAKDDQLKLL
ncbi:MAG: 5'-3' exonuclease H3TH domain-containing protein [Candidatus Berkelbacteria bacterium]